MKTSTIKYLGNLRTEAEHLGSGEKIITEAPPDNNGKGEFFSPTDLMATSLGSCMLTIMGIAAQIHIINIEGTTVGIAKNMEANPRRIGEVVIAFKMPKHNYSDKEKAILENAALNCPVAKSVSADLKQTVVFNY